MSGGAPVAPGRLLRLPRRAESEGIDISDRSGVVDLWASQGGDVEWLFALDGLMRCWDWSLGWPSIADLRAVRRPASRADARHVPVRAFSVTMGAHLSLESGLEQDLVRLLDRDPGVVHLVPQPLVLRWPESEHRARTHIPDLLSMRADGTVMVWDARPGLRTTSGTFAQDVTVTKAACESVGWGYEVFSGLPNVHRYNLVWLNAYRQTPPWLPQCRDEILEVVRRGTTLGEVMRAGGDEWRAVVWHMVWCGDLGVDLTQRIGPSTAVTA